MDKEAAAPNPEDVLVELTPEETELVSGGTSQLQTVLVAEAGGVGSLNLNTRKA